MDMKNQISPLSYTAWTVTEDQFNPNQLHARETVFTIGNGYLGTRGSFEEGYPHASAATLIHGVYDDVPVMYTELVNCPDWLPLVVMVGGNSPDAPSDRFRLDQGEILSYQRQLDVRRGVLSRSVRWRSPAGKTLDLQFERFASLADQHVVALRCRITPSISVAPLKFKQVLMAIPKTRGLTTGSG